MATMQKIDIRQALIKAFSQKFTPENITDYEQCILTEAVYSKGGYTLVAMPILKAEFNNYSKIKRPLKSKAHIGFQVDFIGCSYDSIAEEYVWDSKAYSISYGASSRMSASKIMCVKKKQGELGEDVMDGLFGSLHAEQEAAILSALFDDIKARTQPPMDSLLNLAIPITHKKL